MLVLEVHNLAKITIILLCDPHEDLVKVVPRDGGPSLDSSERDDMMNNTLSRRVECEDGLGQAHSQQLRQGLSVITMCRENGPY